MPLRPSICSQCQLRLQFPRLFHSSTQLARAGNPGRPYQPPTVAPGTRVRLRPVKFTNEEKPRWRDTVRRRVLPTEPEQWRRLILDHLVNWEHRLPVQTLLGTLGLRKTLPRGAYRLFEQSIRDGLKGDGILDERWDWNKIQADSSMSLEQAMDRMLMRQFLKIMPKLVPEHCAFLKDVDEALALTHPAEWHPMARQVHRKIILHVGPTNSGKTYHALRALAGAKYGCYAGPLRLLATEIWARLNRGDIAPIGADTTKKHPRVCNLYTGENIKILDEDAGLMSATVEMVPLTKKFDVVVIDEIQMLSHAERGSAWTQALVGLNAEEIHLCGEESAVDLVKELVRPAGDEVIVNRYERLTPLQIAPRSMRGDLTSIQPGDCVVAFSRNQIFGLKHLIEEKTGLRCAVAYGKLPPEVRVEQATKFNSPVEMDYPVLVASDAIGMGLNLKIKRVIFSTVSKWDGYKNVTLPLSDIKQIAGRAGRYGMHGADAIGIATTLSDNDYPILADAMKTPVSDLTTAILAADSNILSKIHRTLPPQTGLVEIFQLLMDVGTCQTPFALTDYSKLQDAAVVVDTQCPRMSIATRSVLVQCPVPWKIPEAAAMFEKMLQVYNSGQLVDPEAIFEKEGLMSVLEDVAAAQEEHAAKKATQPQAQDTPEEESVLTVREASTRLEALELLHKMACAYLWMSYRFPIAFSMRGRTEEIKLAAEFGIQFCLEMLQTDRAKTMNARLMKAMQTRDAHEKKKTAKVMSNAGLALPEVLI